MITYASVNLIHKYTKTLTPKSITHKFQNLNTKRTVAKLNTQYTPKTEKFRKFYIFKATKTYNTLPNEMKIKNTKTFKTLLKKHILVNQQYDSKD